MSGTHVRHEKTDSNQLIKISLVKSMTQVQHYIYYYQASVTIFVVQMWCFQFSFIYRVQGTSFLPNELNLLNERKIFQITIWVLTVWWMHQPIIYALQYTNRNVWNFGLDCKLLLFKICKPSLRFRWNSILQVVLSFLKLFIQRNHLDCL